MAEVRWPRTKGPRNFTGIGEIVITEGGSGYVDVAKPQINFVSEHGSGASASAVLAGGKVIRADIDAAGSGFLEPTFVEFVAAQGQGSGARGLAFPGTPMPTTNQVVTPWRPGRVVAESPYSQRTQVVDRSSGAWQGSVTIPPTRDKGAAQSVEAMLSALSGEGAWCEIPIGRVGFADHGIIDIPPTRPTNPPTPNPHFGVHDRPPILAPLADGLPPRPNPAYLGIPIRARGGESERTRGDIDFGSIQLEPSDHERQRPGVGGRLKENPKTGDWCRIEGRLYQVAGVTAQSLRATPRDYVSLSPVPPSTVSGGTWVDGKWGGDYVLPARSVRGRLASVETPGGKRQGSVWGPWVIQWVEFVDPVYLAPDTRPIEQTPIVDFQIMSGAQRNINLSSAWRSRLAAFGALTYEKRTSSSAVGLKIVGSVLQVRGRHPGRAAVTVWAHASGEEPAEQTFIVDVSQRSDQTIPSIVKSLPAVNVRAGEVTERDGSIPFGDSDGLLRYSAESTNPGVARVWNAGAGINIRGKSPGKAIGRITARNDAGPATYSLPVVVARITDESTTIGGPVYGASPSVPFPANQNLRFSPKGDAEEALVEPLTEHFHSPEGLPLTFSARETTNLDEGRSALIVPDGDIEGSTLTITAPEKAAGDTAQLVRTVDVTASDQRGRTATGTIQITLTDRPNTPPEWRGNPAVNLSPTRLSSQVTLTNFCIDPDGDDLTFTVKSKPSSSIVTVAINGAVMTVTRVATTERSGSIVVTATDVDGSNQGVDSSPIPVHVGLGAPPDAPTWAESIPFPTLRALENPPGGAFDVKPYVTNNVAGQTASDLSYAVSFSPTSRMNGYINASTGLLTLNPRRKGNVDITLTATATKNGSTASADETYRVVVQPTTNNPPVWRGFRTFPVDVGQSDTKDLTEACTDQENDPISFSLTNAGDAAIATVTLTGGKNLNVTGVKEGLTRVELEATDATGSGRTAVHTVTIDVDQPEEKVTPGGSTPLDSKRILAGEDHTWTGISANMEPNSRGDEPDFSSATAVPNKANTVRATMSGDSLRVQALSSVTVLTNVRVTITAPYPEGRGEVSTYVDVTVVPQPLEKPVWKTIADRQGLPTSPPEGIYLPGLVEYSNRANLIYSHSVSRSIVQTVLVTGTSSVTVDGRAFPPGYLVVAYRGDPPSVPRARVGTTVVTVTATDKTDRRKSSSTNFYIRVTAAGSTNDGDDEDNEDASPGHGDSGGGDG